MKTDYVILSHVNPNLLTNMIAPYRDKGYEFVGGVFITVLTPQPAQVLLYAQALQYTEVK